MTGRLVCIPLFPGFQLLDVAGPVAAFEAASQGACPYGSREDGYHVSLVSPDGGPVASSSGVSLMTAPAAGTGAIDTLLVPGGEGTRAQDLDPRLPAFLRERAPACRRITSVCTGTFLLARAGLIQGCRGTTHWRHAGALARHHPDLDVVPDRIWVRDGRVWSSAGVSAGIDLALALITADLGRDVARRAAREIVVYYQRPGGQSQFSSLEELADADGRFAPLLAWIRANVRRPLRVDDLAAEVAMSPRNFSRRFRAEVGCTPAQAVARIRLEVARTLIETTTRPVAAVAREAGYGDPETMRRAFVRVLGRSPRALRTAAATGAGAGRVPEVPAPPQPSGPQR